MLETNKLLQFDGKYVYNYILNNPNIIEYLKNESVKDYFLEEENHYPFIWLVGNMNDISLRTFLDDNMLKKIESIILEEKNKVGE